MQVKDKATVATSAAVAVTAAVAEFVELHEKLRVSHDALAMALGQFVDQTLRGSHQPTVQQWLKVSEALRGAAEHVEPSRTNPPWLMQVARLIEAAANK